MAGLVAEKAEWREIRSPDDLETEMDFVRLKIELSVEGVRLDRSALEGVGTLYAEEVHFARDLTRRSVAWKERRQ